MNYNVVNKLGEVVKEIELNEAVFGVEYNEQCVFDAIMVARSNSRQATAKTNDFFISTTSLFFLSIQHLYYIFCRKMSIKKVIFIYIHYTLQTYFIQLFFYYRIVKK